MFSQTNSHMAAHQIGAGILQINRLAILNSLTFIVPEAHYHGSGFIAHQTFTDHCPIVHGTGFFQTQNLDWHVNSASSRGQLIYFQIIYLSFGREGAL